MKAQLRRATAADLPEIALLDGRAFGFHYGEQELDDLRGVLDPDRFVMVHDGDTLVGTAGSYEFAVTPPGGEPVPAEGVTWVSVAATHRRRGILRTMITELHRGYVEAGVPLALLTASEGGIYGRFGYGVATVNRTVEIDRRQADFRPDVPDPGGVRYAETDEVRERVPDIHRRWCARHPGALSRSAAWWDFTLLDRPHQRRGGTARFHLLHADGYAAYRMDGGTCWVVDFFAATDSAHVALWRLLLALDLVPTIITRAVPADDPLPWLLSDPRVVRTESVADGVWARVLGVPAVLAARRYAVDVDAVLQVHDPVQDRGGRFRLHGGPDGAECTPTAAAPDLHVDIRALGSLAFGGPRALTLARAGLIGAEDPGSGGALLRRFDAACTPDREPRHGTGF
ncbi:GNAT family N-acetyltransferase [Pseudonocardia sp.]|uniref:GNAT family N-acetyltransferase n=1 Tax=Pseudonocardia sp. TaxID=60912 RepID=UPI002629CBA6|nr:GNAT family N-acetyltransferase [Pseudonocardia sp.]